jgi:hypothetical protein
MVYIEDVGSTFDAPIDHVWKYVYGDKAHDAAHKTTRNPKFEKVSEVTFTYSSERLLRGKWAPDRMRISMFPPISVAIEFLEGVLAGSKLVYVYSPKGEKTGIDVYGEFVSKTLPPAEVEAVAREFLDTEFRDDAPAIRAEYLKLKGEASKAA